METMDERRTVDQSTPPKVRDWFSPQPIARRNVPPSTKFETTVTQVVEVRKPTQDEMKVMFLALLKDNDIIDAIRKFI